MRLPRGIKILNGVSMSLPPEVLLRTFGTEVGEHMLEGDVDAQLRLCLCRPIFRGLAPSLDELHPVPARARGALCRSFKRIIRPTMIDGLVYHHTPFLPLADKTPGARWNTPPPTAHPPSPPSSAPLTTALPITSSARGLDPAKEYQVTLDNQGLTFTASGRELAQTGISVRLEQPLSLRSW